MVVDKAREMNYRPDIIAQLSQRSQNFTLGLAVPDLATPFFASLTSIIAVEAQKP